MFVPAGAVCKPRQQSFHGGMIRRSRRAFLARLAAAVPALLAASRSRAMPGSRADTPGRGVRLFLAGDVMTGRGIDQVLPHHVDPELHEPWVGSALEYVALAEAANGPIPRPVDFDYIWGDGLARLKQAAPHARIVNLETAVTTSDAWLPKGINYRMHPGNVPVLTAAGIHCAVLANNHVLDWGETGLLETLDVLHRAGIATAGAGADEEAAAAPAVLPLDGGGRVLVFACGTGSSGVPRDWDATGWPSCPTWRRPPPMPSPAAWSAGAVPATSSWSPSTGAATGATPSPPPSAPSPAAWSRPGPPTSSTATPRTTSRASRSTATASSSMAAATSSTTTRASAAIRPTATT